MKKCVHPRPRVWDRRGLSDPTAHALSLAQGCSSSSTLPQRSGPLYKIWGQPVPFLRPLEFHSPPSVALCQDRAAVQPDLYRAWTDRLASYSSTWLPRAVPTTPGHRAVSLEIPALPFSVKTTYFPTTAGISELRAGPPFSYERKRPLMLSSGPCC